MSLSIAVFIFMIIVTTYILIIESITVLFRFTGLNEEKSNFQAISLLTNSGFTTNESETIMASRVRRRIAKVTMMIGYMFSVVIASSIINIMISISKTSVKTTSLHIVAIAVFFCLLLLVSKVPFFKRGLDKVVRKAAERTFSRRSTENPIYVLDSYGKDVLCAILVTRVPEMLQNKTIIEAQLRVQYGVSVLTISDDGHHNAINAAKDILKEMDKIVVFGKMDAIKYIFKADGQPPHQHRP